MSRNLVTSTLAVLVAIFSASVASAATINWGGVGPVANASSILNTGTAVEANSFGGGAQTVNSVSFTAGGGSSGGFWTGNGGASTGDAGLNSILNSHTNAGGAGPFTLTFNGLSVGTTYQVQLIGIHDARGCCSARNYDVGNGTGGDSGFDMARNAGGNGATGSLLGSMVGTFTANAISQSVNLTGDASPNNDPGLSGYVLRAASPNYTWTGATSGDWNDPSNWDANGIPLDTLASNNGLTFDDSSDSITFAAGGAANPLPTTNIPGLGGVNNNAGHTPAIDLRSGGTLNISAGLGSIGGLVTEGVTTRTILTVGDGIGGGNEDVTLNMSLSGALNRHIGGGTHNFLVNSDGALNFDSNLPFSSEPLNRWSTFDLAGGAVDVDGFVSGLTDHVNSFVDITALGSTFTADFGGNFGDLADVLANLGDGLAFRSSTGVRLAAVDNGNGSFTVQTVTIPEPSTLVLAAFGLMSLGLGRRRSRK